MSDELAAGWKDSPAQPTLNLVLTIDRPAGCPLCGHGGHDESACPVPAGVPDKEDGMRTESKWFGERS